jgi:signal transduction histidine kinase
MPDVAAANRGVVDALDAAGFPIVRVGRDGRIRGGNATVATWRGSLLPHGEDLAEVLVLEPAERAALLAASDVRRGRGSLLRGDDPPFDVAIGAFGLGPDVVAFSLQVEPAPWLDLQARYAETNSELVNLSRERAKQAARLQRALGERDQAFAALADADRRKTRFFAGVGHELKTPLSTIIGFAEDGQDGLAGPVTEAMRRFLGQIERAGRHLLLVVDDLVDLARIEAGETRLHPEPVHLQAALPDVGDAMRPLLARKGQSLAIEVPPDLPPVEADPGRLHQVLVNLVENARKYTPEGGHVALRAHLAGDRAAIEVVDDGRGIAPADLPHVFEEFRRAQGASSEPGSGLGLAIVRRLVEAHGATIAVASTLGEGTTVTVRWPLAACPPPGGLLP